MESKGSNFSCRLSMQQVQEGQTWMCLSQRQNRKSRAKVALSMPSKLNYHRARTSSAAQ